MGWWAVGWCSHTVEKTRKYIPSDPAAPQEILRPALRSVRQAHRTTRIVGGGPGGTQLSSQGKESSGTRCAPKSRDRCPQHSERKDTERGKVLTQAGLRGWKQSLRPRMRTQHMGGGSRGQEGAPQRKSWEVPTAGVSRAKMQGQAQP